MKNSVIAISLIVLAVSIFFAGFLAGKKESTVKMQASALVIANCTDIAPPNNKTFGSTTLGIINCANQYNKCQAACLSQN